MSATSNEPVVSSYAQAPTRTISASGVTYAYRELGPKGGIPVVFFVHLNATLDNWDPRIVDPIAKGHHVITFDNRGVGASSGEVPDSIEAMADRRLSERTADRDAPIKVTAFLTQLKAIKKWGRSAPADLSKITQPTLIANGDNDRMVPSALSEDLHRRITGSKLIISPDSGHGGIFQSHDQFAPVAVEFLDR